jgi:hypothetical protein
MRRLISESCRSRGEPSLPRTPRASVKQIARLSIVLNRIRRSRRRTRTSLFWEKKRKRRRRKAVIGMI